MLLTEVYKLKSGSTVQVQGNGNGHEPDSVIQLTVQGDAHLSASPAISKDGIRYIWVTTDKGVWPSHRLF